MVSSFVLKNSGSQEDADDIFQDSLIVFYKNVIKSEFKLTAKISTYLFSIAKRLWLKNIQRLNTLNKVTEMLGDEIEELNFELAEHRTDIDSAVINALGQIGGPCAQILEMYYFRKLI